MELDKIYQSEKYEDGIYQSWEQGGFFNPDKLDLPVDAPTYTIILPPPNITDKLHLGHACMLAIEDLFIRFHRMNGYRTLWLPGTDHAAIATQTAVEKKLKKEQGVSRHDLGREGFLAEVKTFVDETQAVIINQTKKMGASLDWSRLAFTLDETRQEAVKEMFCQLYEAGLIYRGERVINWCPRCASTLADDEVEYKEQKAKIYTFKYADNCPITISTTRPETKLGDTAIAVHPSDERYKQYIGQEFAVDFCGVPLKLKVIADRNVESEFGTGALGVTPAHSMVDWQMAEMNNLPIIKVINEAGKIHDGFGQFSGMTAIEAREKVVEELKNRGLLIAEEDMQNNLSVCYRCDTPIEPLPSKQWFVAVDKSTERLGGKSLKQAALEVAKNGEVKFIPERFNKRYSDWMENLRDWCVSRQIWFGHRLPVWYREENKDLGGVDNIPRHPNGCHPSEEGNIFTSSQEGNIYVGRIAPEGEGWVQDSDTLDTWFSSGMWTFSTLGWPGNFVDGQKIGDLARFHPTQVLETGYEIITLWVSRMIMMSLFALNEVPFEKVYLHGMTLDKQGKKMSKSKGNGIDPIDMIKLYGTDAVRLSLLVGTTAGNDGKIYEEKIAVERNFINKLWNVARYIGEKLNGQVINEAIDLGKLTIADTWILTKLDKLIIDSTEEIKNSEFSMAGDVIKEFTWNDLADWYLEATKFERGTETDKILSFTLQTILKLWHPFIPFVTEVIWRELGFGDNLIIAEWPKPIGIKNDDSDRFEIVKNIITVIRNGRSENAIEPAKKLPVIIYVGDQDWLTSQVEIIKSLKTGVSELTILAGGEKPADAISLVASGMEIYLIGGIDKDKEKNRLVKEQENLEKLIVSLQSRLDNEEFTAKAPEQLIAKQTQQLVDARTNLEKVVEALAELK